MKLRFLLLLIFPLFFTSCATVLYKKDYGMKLSAKQPNSSVKINDTVYALPAKIRVMRSKKDLPLTLITDSIQKDFVLKASPTRCFIFGNAAFIYLWPISYGIDFYSPKRFYYGGYATLDANDTITELRKGFLPHLGGNLKQFSIHFKHYFRDQRYGKKGRWNLAFGGSLYSKLYVDNELKSSDYDMLLYSAKAGLDYFYKDGRFVSFRASLIFPFEWFYSDQNIASTRHLEVTDNFEYKRFTFGYGINYSINRLHRLQSIPYYDKYGYANQMCLSQNYNNRSFGISVNAYYQVHNNLHLGFMYRPNFIRISPQFDYKYEYLLGVEVIYKVPFKL